MNNPEATIAAVILLLLVFGMKLVALAVENTRRENRPYEI